MKETVVSECWRALRFQYAADGVGGLTVVLFYGVRVDVHGERRCAVAEPVLCGLDVRLVADGERRLGVTELVELQPPRSPSS